jgi:hypothetical protein
LNSIFTKIHIDSLLDTVTSKANLSNTKIKPYVTPILFSVAYETILTLQDKGDIVNAIGLGEKLIEIADKAHINSEVFKDEVSRLKRLSPK